jgi:hypothetical protein
VVSLYILLPERLQFMFVYSCLKESEPTTLSMSTPFSQLTYLLHLITTLNCDENLPSSLHREALAIASASDPPGFTVLESIAAILVQQHEVVAACYTSDEVSVIAAETAPSYRC